MDSSERFVAVAVRARLLGPDAAQRLLASSKALGRPAWELAVAGLGLEPTARLLGQLVADGDIRPREVVDELGRGGMGRVLRVRDAAAGREVAQKVLLEATRDTPRARSRFLREARITAQLEHPSIVPVYEVSRDPEDPSFIMKLVRGRGLDRIIDEADDEPGPAAIPALVRVFLKVCDAMAYAHSRGVIHRDLKPQNIMVGDFGEVLVMDWGLARLRDEPDDVDRDAQTVAEERETGRVDAGESVERTRDGAIVGTITYMPPEQAGGRRDEVDARSDVYSLGAILYCLLALRPPFDGASALEVLGKLVTEAPPSPRRVAPSRRIPRELEAIALKALAKAPDARYPSARALADDVTRFLEGYPVTALSSGPLARASKWAARNAQLAGSAIAATLTVLLVALGAAVVVADAARDAARSEAARGDAEARLRAAAEAATVMASRRASALVPYFEVADLVHMNLPAATSRQVVIPALEEAVRRDPTFTQGLFDLAYVHFKQGEFGPARARLQEVLARPGAVDPRALYLLAEVERWDGGSGEESVREGGIKAVRALRERTLAVAPDHVLGRLAGAEGIADPSARIVALGELVDEAPYRLPVVSAYAQTLTNADMDGVTRVTPDAWRAMIARLDAALDCVAPEGLARRDAFECHILRASYLKEDGRDREALVDALAAERLIPGLIANDHDLVEAGRLSGPLLVASGREQEGLDVIAHVLKLAPGDMELLNFRGYNHLARGQPVEALDDLAGALQGVRARAGETNATFAYAISALEAQATLGCAIAAAEAGAPDRAAVAVEKLVPLLESRDLFNDPLRVPAREARFASAVAAVSSWYASRGEPARGAELAESLRQVARRRTAQAVASARARDPYAQCVAADQALLAATAAGGLDPIARYRLLRLRAEKRITDQSRVVVHLREALAANPADTPELRMRAAGDRYNLAAMLAHYSIALEDHPLDAVVDETLSLLEGAFERGLTEFRLLREEPAFARLRDLPRFRALLAREQGSRSSPPR